MEEQTNTNEATNTESKVEATGAEKQVHVDAKQEVPGTEVQATEATEVTDQSTEATAVELPSDAKSEAVEAEGTTEEGTGTSEEVSEEVQSVEIPEHYKAAVEAAPEGLKDYMNSIASSGDITAEQRSDLEAKGVHPDLINTMVEYGKSQLGVLDQQVESQALQSNQVKSTEAAIQALGSQEDYMAIKEYADKNADESTLLAYNKAFDSGDTATAVAIIQGLKAQMEASKSVAQNALKSASPKSSSGSVYSSKDEFLQDISDPRYKTDVDFKRAVFAKMERSNKQGTLNI